MSGIVAPPVGIRIVGQTETCRTKSDSSSEAATKTLNFWLTAHTRVPLTSSRSHSSSSWSSRDEEHSNDSLSARFSAFDGLAYAVEFKGNPSINSFEFERIRDLKRQLIFCFLKSISSVNTEEAGIVLLWTERIAGSYLDLGPTRSTFCKRDRNGSCTVISLAPSSPR